MVEYKGYQIKSDPRMPKSYVIVTAGKGGKIPDVMNGAFTSTSVAKEVIDLYTTKREQVDGKKGSQGGG